MDSVTCKNASSLITICLYIKPRNSLKQGTKQKYLKKEVPTWKLSLKGILQCSRQPSIYFAGEKLLSYLPPFLARRVFKVHLICIIPTPLTISVKKRHCLNGWPSLPAKFEPLMLEDKSLLPYSAKDQTPLQASTFQVKHCQTPHADMGSDQKDNWPTQIKLYFNTFTCKLTPNGRKHSLLYCYASALDYIHTHTYIQLHMYRCILRTWHFEEAIYLSS